MKVKLLCVYGDKTPNTIVDLKKEAAEKLIADGNAVDAKDLDVTKDSKEVATLKKRVEALEGEVATLKEKKQALEGEVATLKKG